MVREISPVLWYSGFVVKTGLWMKFNVSIIMQENNLEMKQEN